VVRQLVTVVNALTLGVPYKVDAFALKIEHSFQKAVRAFPGPITSLTFDLVAPNPINGEGATKLALARLRKKENVDSVKTTLKSSEGLKLETGLISGAAAYAENGGGDIQAKSGNTIVYDSALQVKSVDIPDEFRPNGDEISGISDGLSGKLTR